MLWKSCKTSKVVHLNVYAREFQACQTIFPVCSSQPDFLNLVYFALIMRIPDGCSIVRL